MQHLLDSNLTLLFTDEDFESLSVEDKSLVEQYFFEYQEFRIFRKKLLNNEISDKKIIKDGLKTIAKDRTDIFNKNRTAYKVLTEILYGKTIYEFCKMYFGDLYVNLTEEINNKIDSFLIKSAQFKKMSKGKEKYHADLLLAVFNEYENIGGDSFFKVANTPYLEIMLDIPKYSLTLNSVLNDLVVKTNDISYRANNDNSIIELNEDSTFEELLSVVNKPTDKNEYEKQKYFIEKFGFRLLKTVEFKKYLDAISNYNSEDDEYNGAEFKIERQIYALKIILKELGATSKTIDQTDIARFCQFLTKRCLGVPKIHHSELYKNIINKNVNNKDKEFVKNQLKSIGLEELFYKYQ